MQLRVGALVLVAALASRAAATEEPVATVETERAYQPVSRVYVSMSGFGGRSGFGYTGDDLPPAIGGLVGTTGAELALDNGATLGFEIAPFTWVSATTRPSLSARIAVGYARRKIAIALEVGSTLTWLYPQLGPSLRIGALDGTYARLRLSWAIYPAVPVPVDLDFELSTPISPRLRAGVNLGAVYGNTTGAFGTVGVSYLPSGSRSLRGGAFSVGVGVGWIQWALGPMVTVGYERRL
jgi:hypothetical protein